MIDEMIKIGLVFYHGRQDNKAYDQFIKIAKLGNAEAQYRVGKITLRLPSGFNGSGAVEKLAGRWLEKAFINGSPLALVEIFLNERIGFLKAILSEREFFDFLERSQESSSAEALYACALVKMKFPDLVKMNFDQLLKTSAEQGFVEAMRDWGEWLWTHGDNEKAEAIRYLRHAALAGSMQAQYLLGVRYATDVDFFDIKNSQKFYTMAALNGHSQSLYHIGRSLLGDKKKRLYGLELLKLSAQQGCFDARDLIELDEEKRGINVTDWSSVFLLQEKAMRAWVDYVLAIGC